MTVCPRRTRGPVSVQALHFYSPFDNRHFEFCLGADTAWLEADRVRPVAGLCFRSLIPLPSAPALAPVSPRAPCC